MPVCQGKWGEAGPMGEGIVPTTPLLLFYSKTAQPADIAGVHSPLCAMFWGSETCQLTHIPII